jgi:hypothetical protein
MSTPLTGSSLRARLQPLQRHSVFGDPDWLIWCGTAARTSDGQCHLLYSRWPKSLGHGAWVTHSEIAYATAPTLLGPWTHQHVALAGAGGSAWDRDVTHNPTLLEHAGKFYLYYVGNYGDREYWNHRNHQRVGVAVADHPAGPWTRFDRPLIDVSPNSFDAIITSNPTVFRQPDGRFCMIYKAVTSAGPPPKFGAVICGVAHADHPLGPFVKHDQPIMVNPTNPWSVEDPYAWSQDGKFYCLVKDFQGYFANSERAVLVLFESADALHWHPAPDPLFLKRELHWSDGTTQRVDALERPQLVFENGQPIALLLAMAPNPGRADSMNIQIEITRP